MSSSTPCGCVHEPLVDERMAVWNDAGKSTLSVRIGTFGSFKRAMLVGLADAGSLRELTTRSPDDPTIAMVNAWAATLDVLSFYQERINNESYLRTAIERRSVLELARTIGYELNPGVAASVYLSFTVDDAPGGPEEVRLDIGTRAQSQPEQDETPQTFETTEQIVALRTLNALRARTRRRIVPVFGSTYATLAGRSTGLKSGDAILIVGDEREGDVTTERWDFRRVESVETDDTNDITTIRWAEGLGATRGGVVTQPASADLRVYALKTRANLFGYNAPSKKAMMEVAKATNPQASGITPIEWDNLTISYTASVPSTTDTIHLDAPYPQILAGSWVVLSRPAVSDRTSPEVEAYKVVEALEDSVTAFTLSGRTTRLKLSGERLVEAFGSHLRTTQVFAESIELPLADEVITDPVEGTILQLSASVEGLDADRWIGVWGTRVDDGSAYSGAFQIAEVRSVDGLTEVELTAALPALVRSSVLVNGNVAFATHGESTAETLGSGSAATANQRFKLKKSPLTFVPSDAASGQESTLEVRVNNLLWTEVPTHYGAQPTDRTYTIRLNDAGETYVQFGDGARGSRLPSGVDNVKATYRTGIGLDGIVKANQIKILMSRPLGLKEVLNPAASDSAADPETLDSARTNAPMRVLTLDRVVSLQDYEDFARAFAGIAKAQAGAVWSGQDRLVHLTVAGEDGASVTSTSTLGQRLLASIDGARHADRQIRFDSFESLPFVVQAVVLPDAAYVLADVLAAAKQKLIDAFSFDAMSLGQSVALSDVLAVLQSADGVVAAQVIALYEVGATAQRNERLIARRVRLEAGLVRPAQLLALDANLTTVLEMTP